MSTPNETPPCLGITGRLFGHKMRGRYDETSGLPKGNLDVPLKGLNVASAIRFTEAMKDRTRTYRGDVCERCGWSPVPGESDAE